MGIDWFGIFDSVTTLLFGAGIFALSIFIPYKLIKRLIKFSIEYYFQLKKLNDKKD